MLRRNRGSVALVLSLVLHGLFVLWVTLRPVPPPVRSAAPPVEVRIIHLPPAPTPSHRVPAPVPSPATRTRLPPDRATAVGPLTSPATPAPTPGPAESGQRDRPMALNLIPSLPTGGSDGPGIAVPSHGQTIHNDGSQPDAQAVRAYQAEQATRLVNGWEKELLADARAQRGLVSPYFDDLKHALEQALNESPPPVPRRAFEDASKVAAATFDELANQAASYGKTGNPLGPVNPDVDDVESRNSANTQAMLRDPGGQTSAGQIGAALAQMEPARRMLRRAEDEMKLSAIVELLQARDGQVREAKLKKGSGNKSFDDGVLAAAPRIAGKLRPPEGPGLGTDPDQIRSLWEFQGRLKYLKKAKSVAKGSNAGTTALEALASVATGSMAFDETNGSVELLDLAHPTIEFTAKLLKLY